MNNIRQQLIENFRAYAGGKPLFGEALGRSQPTPAGDYRVMLTVDGKKVTGKITIRNDPCWISKSEMKF